MQTRESSPARDRRSTAEPPNQLVYSQTASDQVAVDNTQDPWTSSPQAQQDASDTREVCLLEPRSDVALVYGGRGRPSRSRRRADAVKPSTRLAETHARQHGPC